MDITEIREMEVGDLVRFDVDERRGNTIFKDKIWLEGVIIEISKVDHTFERLWGDQTNNGRKYCWVRVVLRTSYKNMRTFTVDSLRLRKAI